MALPPAVKKVRVTFGSGATQVTGSDVSTEVSFTPTAAVIWAATGVPLLNPTEIVTSEPGEEAVAEIVNPNQPGFIDGNGNAVRDYGVRVAVRYLAGGKQVGAILTKLVKFAEDDDTVDLDLMIPITSASGTVVYIPDSWSEGVLEAQTAAIDALAAAERAEAAAADVDLSGLEPAGLSDETKASLSNTIGAAVAAGGGATSGWLKNMFLGQNLYTFGTSYLAEQDLDDATRYYARQFARATGMVYPTSVGGTYNDLKRAVGGSTTPHTANLVLTDATRSWVSGTKGAVLIEALTNSARLYGANNALGLEYVRQLLRQILAVFNSTERIHFDESARFTYSGAWTTVTSASASGGSYRRTAAVGAYVEFTKPADGLDWYVLVYGKGTATGTPTVKVSDITSATVISETNLSARTPDTGTNVWMPVLIPKSADGHLVRIAKSDTATGTSDSLIVNVALPQSRTPIPVFAMKEPYLATYSTTGSFPNGSDLAYDQFNALWDEIALEWTNVSVADPQYAGYWDEDTDTVADGVHPDEEGSDHLFATLLDSVLGAAFRRALTATAAPATPVSDTVAPSQPTGLTATPGTSSMALSWTASSDAFGVTGYKVYVNGVYNSTTATTTKTVTGLPIASHSFTVTAIDAAGNESAPSAAQVQTPIDPAAPYDFTADSLLSYYFDTDGLSTLAVGALVPALTKAAGTETVLLDRSATTTRQGTIVAAPGGNTHRGVLLDGTDDAYASTALATNINQTTGMTFLFTGQVRNALGTLLSGLSSVATITVAENSTGTALRVTAGSDTTLFVEAPLTAGMDEHQIAVTLGAAGACTVQVDGTKVSGTISTATAAALSGLRAGENQSGGARLSGVIRRWALLRRVLSDEQINLSLAKMVAA
jgi:hypothetical protein